MSNPLIESELASKGVAQVIVVLNSPPVAAAGKSGAMALGAGGGGASGMAQYFRSSELSLNSQIAAGGMKKAALSVSAADKPGKIKAPPPVHYFPNLGVMLGTVDQQGLAGLEANANVASVTAAPLLRPIWPERVAAAAAPKELTWGLKQLNVEALWNAGITGKGVRVGQLDTGIDGDHPTIKNGALYKFAEFDFFGSIVKPTPKPRDTDDHGTHTAATIAGRGVGNRHVGVAPGAELLGAIVIEGGNAIARVLGGIDWALGEGMRVLSLSLGFPGWTDQFEPIMAVLRARNVLPVVAAGNEGVGNTRSPGNYPNVLSVGAMDVNGHIPVFSSSGAFMRTLRPNVPYLVAPGVDVISAKPGGGYQSMDGTSMATPHVAGLAALLFEAKPSATANEVEEAILQSCKRSPGMTAARAGAGCPDAIRAYEILTGTKLAAKPSTKGKKKKPAKKKVTASTKRAAAKRKKPAKRRKA